jgi:ATP-dependent exoDNAse (exonuclease V) alpha subunit
VAPTGAAACQIGGSTIHATIGIKSDNKDELSQATTASLTKARLRLREIKIIIIDEISMVRQRLLAKLDVRAALI